MSSRQSTYSSASAPQPYGTAIPIQSQRPPTSAPQQRASTSPYGSGSAPAQVAPPKPSPGTPYRPVQPVQAGPNSMMGYSPSQARGYGSTPPAPVVQPQVPSAAPERPPQGYTPQQQQLLAMRQQQSAMLAPAPPAAAPAPPQQLRAATPAQAPAPQVVRLERTIRNVQELNAPWNNQGVVAPWLSVQGTSLVFQQACVVALYISVPKAPADTLLRIVNPLTQSVVFFTYGNEESVYLSFVKAVEQGEAWQVYLMVPRPEEGDETPASIPEVVVSAQVMRL